MCFDLEARPPIAPIAGGATDAGRFMLTSPDGTQFDAYRARAASPTGAGMVVIPDVRGLHPYYEELAVRFAEIGVDAVAIDFFARSAGTGPRDKDFDFMSHVPRTTPATLQADIAAAVAHLRSPAGGGVTSLFSVGFCFGGALAYLQAASGLGYAGVIGFYGWPLGLARWPDRPKPIDAAARFACPVLSIFGGADPGIPAAAIDAFDQALRQARVAHENVVYPDAPHSFFDRRQSEFAEASADAWRRVQAFVRSKTAAAPGKGESKR
jgi:carboxymethylenebutenolidase